MYVVAINCLDNGNHCLYSESSFETIDEAVEYGKQALSKDSLPDYIVITDFQIGIADHFK